MLRVGPEVFGTAIKVQIRVADHQGVYSPPVPHCTWLLTEHYGKSLKWLREWLHSVIVSEVRGRNLATVVRPRPIT